MNATQSSLLNITARMQRAGLILTVRTLSPAHRQAAYQLQAAQYRAPLTPAQSRPIGFVYPLKEV